MEFCWLCNEAPKIHILSFRLTQNRVFMYEPTIKGTFIMMMNKTHNQICFLCTFLRKLLKNATPKKLTPKQETNTQISMEIFYTFYDLRSLPLTLPEQGCNALS